jgi:hypothetical protein
MPITAEIFLLTSLLWQLVRCTTKESSRVQAKQRPRRVPQRFAGDRYTRARLPGRIVHYRDEIGRGIVTPEGVTKSFERSFATLAPGAVSA